MSDRLTGGAEARGALGHVLLVVLGFAAVGVLAGWVWEALWDAPNGLVIEETWVPDPNVPDAYFAGPALYVLVALPAGLLAGLAAALLRGREALTLAAVLVGSALAGWLMYLVGNALGPPDPSVVAAGAPDLTPVPDDLVLEAPGEPSGADRPTALLALPFGALLGLVLIYLSGVRSHPRG